MEACDSGSVASGWNVSDADSNVKGSYGSDCQADAGVVSNEVGYSYIGGSGE